METGRTTSAREATHIREVWTTVYSSQGRRGGTMTHTPGPWKVIDELKEVNAIGIYAKEGAVLICELRDPEDAAEAERMLKNAPVIAAAPAMYEALKLALGKLENLSKFSSEGGDFSFIRQAIIKAEGRTE